MDRKQVVTFNNVYAAEATPEERQLVSDMLQVWAKLETSVQKNPALIRKGVLFGLALQKAITAGQVIIPPVRAKRPATKPQEQA